MKKKIECVICTKQNYSNYSKYAAKTFISIRTIPLSYINENYGSVENFISTENDKTYKADTYKISFSKDYDDKYLINKDILIKLKPFKMYKRGTSNEEK